jgi:translation initiation factor 3 subunit B
MTTQYENLPEGDEIDVDEIDFSDLRDQYEVRLEEGLDTFVVLDGLPKVPPESIPKLKKFIMKKISPVSKVREEAFHMPLGSDDITEGYVYLDHV